MSCVLDGEELYHIGLSVQNLAVLTVAGLDEWYPTVDAVVIHRAP